MKAIGALISGALFGSGLIVSGMIDPANVLGFLDVAGAWRPALAFTMGGAILVVAPAFFFVRRVRRTVLGEAVELPERRSIDARLVIGSAIFGVGWGMSGICPGPGLVLLTTGLPQAGVFVTSVVIGIMLSRLSARATATLDERATRPSRRSP